MKNVKQSVNNELKSENILFDALGAEIERLRIKRDELYKIVKDDKKHPQFAEYCEANRKYLDRVFSLPPVSEEIQHKAIILFNSDKKYKITE